MPADARLTQGWLEVDMSMLTGESNPIERVAGPSATGPSLLRERNLVFSGTTCVGGEAQALVFATGGHTELGRIAALSERTGRKDSPLERQIKRVAWLISLVAVGIGVAFLLVGVAAGLSPQAVHVKGAPEAVLARTAGSDAHQVLMAVTRWPSAGSASWPSPPGSCPDPRRHSGTRPSTTCGWLAWWAFMTRPARR